MKNQTLKIWGIRLGLMALPFIAGAATVESIYSNIVNLINWVITILFGLVTIYFFWGVIQYVMAGGKEEAIKAGRDHMVWGIIGMAVIAAAWGIAQVFITYFGVGGQSIPSKPGQL